MIPQEEDEDEAAEMEEMPVKEEAVDIDPTQFLEENNEVTKGHFMFSLYLFLWLNISQNVSVCSVYDVFVCRFFFIFTPLEYHFFFIFNQLVW